MPPATVAVLTKAMAEALKDPAMLAEAAKIGIDIEPMSGAETAQLFVDVYKTPPEVVKKAREIMGRQ
jgi:hypothetical protein